MELTICWSSRLESRAALLPVILQRRTHERVIFDNRPAPFFRTGANPRTAARLWPSRLLKNRLGGFIRTLVQYYYGHLVNRG